VEGGGFSRRLRNDLGPREKEEADFTTTHCYLKLEKKYEGEKSGHGGGKHQFNTFETTFTTEKQWDVN